MLKIVSEILNEERRKDLHELWQSGVCLHGQIFYPRRGYTDMFSEKQRKNIKRLRLSKATEDKLQPKNKTNK